MAEIQCEIPKCEVTDVLSEPIQSVLQIMRRKAPSPREMHQRPLGFERQEHAREQAGASELLGQAFPSGLAEENAEVGGRIDIEPPDGHP